MIEKKEKVINKRLLFGSIAVAMLVVGATFGIVSILSVDNTIDEKIIEEIIIPEKPRTWHELGSDASPGAGDSGVINVYIYPHSADPGTDYATNLTEGAAYAHFDGTPSLDEALDGNVPYDTEFDIVVRCRYNNTHAYNSTTPGWDMTYVKALMTCADLSIGADTEMSEVQVATAGTTYMWVQFYVNNAAAGYTIAHGETVNVTSFKQQAYY